MLTDCKIKFEIFFTDGKRFVPLPSEWINISMKSDAVVTSPAGRVLELECEAVGSPPPSIKWHHGTNIVTEVIDMID